MARVRCSAGARPAPGALLPADPRLLALLSLQSRVSTAGVLQPETVHHGPRHVGHCNVLMYCSTVLSWYQACWAVSASWRPWPACRWWLSPTHCASSSPVPRSPSSSPPCCSDTRSAPSTSPPAPRYSPAWCSCASLPLYSNMGRPNGTYPRYLMPVKPLQ